MDIKKGYKLFFKIFGFLILMGSIALIVLGLVYIIPKAETILIPEEFYYLIGGIAGALISCIVLILAFHKINKKENLLPFEPVFLKKPDPNTWNSKPEQMQPVTRTSSPPFLNKKSATAKEKRTVSTICLRCGTENEAGSYYCCGCKSALEKICKFCGHDNPRGTKICEGCKKVMPG